MDIRRYDIVQADLGKTIGSEQGGVRPVLVIQKDTDNGLKTDSVVLGEQMRVISSQRIIRKIGSVTDNDTKLAIKKVYVAYFGE